MEHPKRLTGSSSSPQNVAEARLMVEASRQRISATLDELEDRFLDRKQQLRRRLDVVRPVRTFVARRPLAGVAIATGAGVLLGVLGKREPDDQEEELGEAEVAAIRRWRRERRKHLLAAAEDELPGFEAPRSGFRRMLRDMTHELAGAATALLIAAIVERVRGAEREAAGIRPGVDADDFDTDDFDDPGY